MKLILSPEALHFTLLRPLSSAKRLLCRRETSHRAPGFFCYTSIFILARQRVHMQQRSTLARRDALVSYQQSRGAVLATSF